jgi:hypothetical protein
MVLDEDNVIGTYGTNAAAEEVVKELRKAGFDITNLSIIQKGVDIEHRIVGFDGEDERSRYWGTRGALWGSAFGAFSALILFYSSQSMRLEIVIKLLAAALIGSIAFGLLSVVGATIYGKVLTRENAFRYDRRVEADDRFVLLAHSAREAAVARDTIAAMEQSVRFDAAPGDANERPPTNKEAVNLPAVAGSRGGKLRLVFQRRLARLRGQ